MYELIYGNNGVEDTEIKNGLYSEDGSNILSKEKAPADVTALISSRLLSVNNAVNTSPGRYDAVSYMIPEIVSSDGNKYTAMGMVRNLKNDDRNSKMSDTIIMKKNDSSDLIDISKAKFLTDEDFAKYVKFFNEKDNVRYSLEEKETEISDENLKKVAAAIFETFARSNPAPNASIVFSANDNIEFNSVSYSIYKKILKYLPYSFRKELTFLGRVDTYGRQPGAVHDYKFVAYSNDEPKYLPKDCIDIFGSNAADESRFDKFADVIVSLSDDERKELFDLFANEFDTVEGKLHSEDYMLIYSKLTYWKGDVSECIDDWLNKDSIELIEKYPYLYNTVKERLLQHTEEFGDKISENAAKAADIKSLTEYYTVISGFCDRLGISKDAVNESFASKAQEFIFDSTNIDELFAKASEASECKDVFFTGDFNDKLYDKGIGFMNACDSIDSLMAASEKVFGFSHTDIFKERDNEIKTCIYKCASDIIDKSVNDVKASAQPSHMYRSMYDEYRQLRLQYSGNDNGAAIFAQCVDDKMNEISNDVQEEIRAEIRDKKDALRRDISLISGQNGMGYTEKASNDVFADCKAIQENIDGFIRECEGSDAVSGLTESYKYELYNSYIESLCHYFENYIDKDTVISFNKNGQAVKAWFKKLHSKEGDRYRDLNTVLSVFDNIEDISKILVAKSTDRNAGIIKFVDDFYGKNTDSRGGHGKRDKFKYYRDLLADISVKIDDKKKSSFIKGIDKQLKKSGEDDRAKKAICYIFGIEPPAKKGSGGKQNKGGMQYGEDDFYSSSHANRSKNKKAAQKKRSRIIIASMIVVGLIIALTAAFAIYKIINKDDGKKNPSQEPTTTVTETTTSSQGTTAAVVSETTQNTTEAVTQEKETVTSTYETETTTAEATTEISAEESTGETTTKKSSNRFSRKEGA